jgi:hypothetical protein
LRWVGKCSAARAGEGERAQTGGAGEPLGCVRGIRGRLVRRGAGAGTGVKGCKRSTGIVQKAGDEA